MKFWNGSPQAKLAVIGSFLALALLSGLGGCAGGSESPIERVMRIVGGGHSLPPEARREYDRFDAVYRQVSHDRDDDNLRYFSTAYKRLRTSYVRPVDDKALMDAAIEGVEKAQGEKERPGPAGYIEAALDAMTASLDPHTAYLNRQEHQDTLVKLKGEFGGLGIVVSMEDGLVKVVSPIEDTPAARAGMKSGDLITNVDGNAILGMSLRDAVTLMRGAPGTEILLKVRRGEEPEFDLTLVRAVIKVKPVKWRLEGNVGYIRVSHFNELMESGMKTALAGIRRELGGEPEGIVLDLRGNPGGSLGQSIYLADMFLDGGEIVSVRGRSSRDVRSFAADRGGLARNIPMVVLINGGSASASEIVASSLKVHDRATVMGTRSFGKGSVQTIIGLPYYGGLKLTTALYYGPDGKTIQGNGVVPDIRLIPEEELETRKESDNPGAITARDNVDVSGQSRVHITACPEIGEQKDRELGCALDFLKAGSKQKFLAAHGGTRQM